MTVEEITNAANAAGALLPKTVASVDDAVSTVVNVFNDILLYPVKKANLTFRYKLEQFSGDLAKEIESRKTTVFTQPDIAIVGPAVEAMRYTMDVDEIRSMYVKLLAASVDANISESVHPSFVELIKRMSSLDAKIFKKLSTCHGYTRIANPKIIISGTNKYFNNETPEWYLDLSDVSSDIFAVSSSLVRLSKLGVIDLLYDKDIDHIRCEWVLQSKALQAILESCKKKYAPQKVELMWMDSVLLVNDYGKQFAKVCL